MTDEVVQYRTDGPVATITINRPDRRTEELYDIVPANPRQAYDVHKVIGALADDGDFFPMKPDWARNIVTGFARFGGRPVCDAFHLPLLFLVDCPGFLVGSAIEKQGIIRHGSKMLFARVLPV